MLCKARRNRLIIDYICDQSNLMRHWGESQTVANSILRCKVEEPEKTKFEGNMSKKNKNDGVYTGMSLSRSFVNTVMAKSRSSLSVSVRSCLPSFSDFKISMAI